MDQIIFALPLSMDTTQLILACNGILAASLLLGSIMKVLQGKESPLANALSSTVAIIFIYIITVIVLSGGESYVTLREYLSPLPFLSLENEQFFIPLLKEINQHELCVEIIKLMVLAILMNLTDSILPEGEHIITWILFRCLTVTVSILAHSAITVGISGPISELIASNAEFILTGLLIIMLAVGCLKYLVGIAIATINPILAALYAFFFAGITGQLLSKSLLTTLFLLLILWFMNTAEISVISFTDISNCLLWATVGLLTALWYGINQIRKK